MSKLQRLGFLPALLVAAAALAQDQIVHDAE